MNLADKKEEKQTYQNNVSMSMTKQQRNEISQSRIKVLDTFSALDHEKGSLY
jgi:hypothetical protein